MKNKKYSVNNRIALDSNCFTYLFQAMKDGYDPSKDCDKKVAKEKVALIKIFLHVGKIWILPVVKEEMDNITRQSVKDGHLRLAGVLLNEVDNLDNDIVSEKSEYYKQFYKKDMDCLVLAQAEVFGLDILLTFDRKFLRFLQDKTEFVELLKPSVYFKLLGLPKESKPKVYPDLGNPLRSMDWWKNP